MFSHQAIQTPIEIKLYYSLKISMICCMMKPYIKDGKCAISSPIHTLMCKSPPVDITNMKWTNNNMD